MDPVVLEGKTTRRPIPATSPRASRGGSGGLL